jgi:hypothetical protein
MAIITNEIIEARKRWKDITNIADDIDSASEWIGFKTSFWEDVSVEAANAKEKYMGLLKGAMNARTK